MHHFNLARAHKPKFGRFFFAIAVSNFLLVSLLSFFSVFNCRYLLRFILFLTAAKMWVFIMDNAWILDLDEL